MIYIKELERSLLLPGRITAVASSLATLPLPSPSCGPFPTEQSDRVTPGPCSSFPFPQNESPRPNRGL